MPPLNFEKGIRKIKATVHPSLKLTKEAFDLLSDLCNDLNTQLVESSKREFKSARTAADEEMSPQSAQNAVRKIFKYKIRDFAISEGQKAVYKYSNDVLTFDKNKALKPDPMDLHRPIRVRQPKPPGNEFSLKLNNLLSYIHRGAGISNKARIFVGGLLHRMCQSLTDDAAEAADGKDAVILDDVMTVIGKRFGPTMFEHAHAEGRHNVDLYHQGVLIFHPSKKRKEVKVESLDPAMSKRRLAVFLAEQYKSWENRNRNIFVLGLKKLASQLQSLNDLDSRAFRRSDTILMLLLKRITYQVINDVVDHNLEYLDAYPFKRTITSVFPKDMLFHAQSEGERAVALFNSHLIHFKPKPRQTMSTVELRKQKRRKLIRSKKKSKLQETHKKTSEASSKPKMAKPIVPDFTQGLNALMMELGDHDYGSMNRNTYEFINKALYGVTKKVAEAATTRYAEGINELTTKEVRDAVKEIFEGRTSEHAMAHGNLAVTSHTQRLLEKSRPQHEKMTTEETSDATLSPPASEPGTVSEPPSGLVTPAPELELENM